MKRKLEISELIFKVISYTLLTVFALGCLYPFVYAISASMSGRHAVEYGEVVLFPKDVQFNAFRQMFNDNMFWNAYSNTLFLTIYGTIWALGVAILGAYALSKKRRCLAVFLEEISFEDDPGLEMYIYVNQNIMAQSMKTDTIFEKTSLRYAEYRAKSPAKE